MRLFCIFILGFTLPALAAVEKSEFDSVGIKKLNVSNSIGRIVISGGDQNKIIVKADKVVFGEKCELEIEKSKGVLNIEVEKEGWFNSDKCKVNFEVQIPQKMALRLRNGSGNIQVSNTEGMVDFAVGSGNVKVNAVKVVDLEGKTGSGSVEVTGISGSSVIKTGSGNVSLTYLEIPINGEVDIKSGSGNAEVNLPEKSKISVEHKAGSGRMSSEFPNNDKSGFSISMMAGSGNLSVKKR